jgi:NADPH-dependent 2,4-dienoyl-CoA reductase/sulfur reductase-like enzyme
MKAVIIGGVAAGMSAASKIKRNDPTAEVTVYEKGHFLSYGACGLPYFVSGENPDYTKMIARTREQFEKLGIRTHLKHEVMSVSPEKKTITVKDLNSGNIFEASYDSLMVATGCTSVVPPIPGVDNNGVFYIKTLEDGLVLQKIAANSSIRRCVVIGGGYIGIEMTEAFLHLGKDVTVIEGANRILSPFEPEFSEMATQELIQNGAQVKTGERVMAIEEQQTHRLVRTSHGEYQADIILMSVGVMPATQFLKETGIRMAKNGALIVDREMRTSIPGIYAAGDCAVTYNKVMEEDYFLPLGTVANKCGRIAGGNMLGRHDKFVGALGTAAIKVCGIEMGRTGMSEADAIRLGIDYRTKLITYYNHPPYYPGQTALAIKLIYEKGTRRLLGACAAGQQGAVLRVDMFAIAIHAGLTTTELGMVDLAYAPPFAGVWDAVHIAANAAK